MSVVMTWRRSLALSAVINFFIVLLFGMLVIVSETKPQEQELIEVALSGSDSSGGGEAGPFVSDQSFTPAPYAAPVSPEQMAMADAREAQLVVKRPLDTGQKTVDRHVTAIGRNEQAKRGGGNGGEGGNISGTGSGPGPGAGTGNAFSGGGFSQDANGIYTALHADGIQYTILSQIEPVYPEEARSISYSRTVVVNTQFVVGLEGQVESIQFLNSPPNLGFKEATSRALKQWEFAPIYFQGVNIKCTFVKNFYFQSN